MNRFVFDNNGGFLIIETKWGNICVEQSEFSTAVKFIPNNFPGDHNPSHIKNRSYPNITVISMESDKDTE